MANAFCASRSSLLAVANAVPQTSAGLQRAAMVARPRVNMSKMAGCFVANNSNGNDSRTMRLSQIWPTRQHRLPLVPITSAAVDTAQKLYYWIGVVPEAACWSGVENHKVQLVFPLTLLLSLIAEILTEKMGCISGWVAAPSFGRCAVATVLIFYCRWRQFWKLCNY